MTLTLDRPPVPHESGAPLPVRLSLKPEGSPSGLLDGAWWPRSRDLNRELPALTAALAPRWGRITRITVNPRHWPVVPRKVPVAGRVVKVGWFTTEQDPHKLLLLFRGAGRGDLLVIPPETGAAAAARLMAAATDPLRPLTASALMAAEGVRGDAAAAGGHGHAAAAGEHGEEEPGEQVQNWVSEGGSFTPPSMAAPATGTRRPAGM